MRSDRSSREERPNEKKSEKPEAVASIEAAPPEVPPSSMSPDDIDEIVEAWWRDHVRGSSVGRDTEAYSYLRGKLTVLKDRLKGG